MEEEDDKVFDTHGLSFDSTLESLMEADYLTDNKDTSFIPLTEAETSTQINYGVDLSSVDGGSNSYVQEPPIKDKHQSVRNNPAMSKEQTDMETDKGAERSEDVVETIGTEDARTKSNVITNGCSNENIKDSKLRPDPVMLAEKQQAVKDKIVEVPINVRKSRKLPDDNKSAKVVNKINIDGNKSEIEVSEKRVEVKHVSESIGKADTNEKLSKVLIEERSKEHKIGSHIEHKSDMIIEKRQEIQDYIVEVPLNVCKPATLLNDKVIVDVVQKVEVNSDTAEALNASNKKTKVQKDKTVEETIKVKNKKPEHIEELPDEHSKRINKTVIKAGSQSHDLKKSVEVKANQIELQTETDNRTNIGENSHVNNTSKDSAQKHSEASIDETDIRNEQEKECQSVKLKNSDTCSENNDHLNTDANDRHKTETTNANIGSIDKLNLDELKAKRMKKLAEKSSAKTLDVRTGEIIGENISLVKSSGKRKLDQLDYETQEIASKSKRLETSEIDRHISVESNMDTPLKVTEETINTDQDTLNSCDMEINNSDDIDKLANIPLSSDDTESVSEMIVHVTSSDGAFDSESMNETITEDNNAYVIDEIEDVDDANINSDTQSQGDNDAEETVQDAFYSGDESSENDLDENEIEAWLDEGLNKKDTDDKAERPEQDLKPGEFIAREKVVLEEKGVSPFEVLPPGWVQVSHMSGMFVYLHKESRTCSLSKPYCLGPLSVRKHDIPISAIPCLQYRKALQREQETEAKETSNADDPLVNGDGTESAEKAAPQIMPQAVLQSVDKAYMLESNELYDYCKGLFKFKTVTVKKFKTWREKRTHMVEEKKNRPGLPSNTKLITCALPNDPNDKTKRRKKDFVLNPVGKTPVCILHEFTQHILRVQPTYEFKEIENSETPFKASVLISGIQYGSGVASGKRQAKAEAAKATLEVFMPEVAAQFKDSNALTKQKEDERADLSYFEDVTIEDPRVTDLCDKAALPKPYQVLVECLRRNFGLGDTNLAVDKKIVSNQRTEFSLTVGKHTAKVVCKNKREGKQRAAQAMLKILHPHLTSWSSILRLYSKSTELGFKEREEDMAVAQSQNSKEKNFEILEKLKEAMRKVQSQRDVDIKKEKKPPIQSINQPLDL